MDIRINDKQREALRFILSKEPVGCELVDGRTGKALLARGLIRLHRHMLSATELGRQVLVAEPAPRRRRKAKNPARVARASAILTATDRLAAAIPHGAEVAVGSIFAGADDVVEGLRRYAKRLRKGREKGTERG